MSRPNRIALLTAIILATVMIAATTLAGVLKPRERLADIGPKLDLERLIPTSFGDWQVDDSLPYVLPSPDVQAQLNKIYNQTLTRTYINKKNERIMLSIAYGGDQSDSLSLHHPEGCYKGQGFGVTRKGTALLNLPVGPLPVARLVANNTSRHEPITYWIVVGERRALTDFEIKKIKLAYAFNGIIPDGILVRVSSIDPDESHAFSSQQQFIDALVRALPPTQRSRIAGVD